MKIPPTDMRIRLYGTFSDPDVWIETGIYSFLHLRNTYKIKPTDNVLDLGCGAGRLLLPFISYLTTGSYYGLDVNKEMIDWCNANMKWPNVSFQWADVKNSQYSPNSLQLDSNYIFPYSDNTFEFGFALSLFTHLLEKGSKNYLKEIYRILKPNGKFMLSAFILNDENIKNVQSDIAPWTFKFKDSEICFYDLKESPEATVAFTLDGIIQIIMDAGFKIENIKLGTWSASKPHTGPQDEILIVKN